MSYEIKLLLVIFAWGVNYVIIPYGLGPLGAGPFTLMRFTLALPLLFLLLLLRGDFFIARSDWGRMILIGFVGTAGYQAAFAVAVNSTTTANAAILFSLSPLFSVLLNCLSGRERPSWINWVGLVLAFSGGLVMILSDGSTFALNPSHLKGDLFMLAAAVLWALAAFLSERCLKRYGGLKVTAWSLPSGVLGLILFSGYETFSVNFGLIPAGAWWALAFAVMGATIMGLVFFYDALPHLGTGQVMSYMYLIPVVAIFSECVISSSWLNSMQLVGVGLALYGVALARKKIVQEKNVSKPTNVQYEN